MKMNLFHIVPPRKIAHYFFFAFGGLLLDITVSNILVYGAGFPLILAGLCGLLAAALAAYFTTLTITFREKGLVASWISFYKYLQTFFVGIGVRMLSLALLGWLTSLPSFLSFLLAIGLSMGVMRLLSRFYVFRT